jgi:5-methylcytosine-specific restriction protein A
MPMRPARACSEFGCPNIEPCAAHGRKARAKAYDRWRGTASSRGYGARWAAYRQWYLHELIRLHVPRAALCGSRLPGAPETRDSECAQLGAIVAATVVDHIRPVTGPNDPTFYEPTAHQALCERCHNRKRQTERRS